MHRIVAWSKRIGVAVYVLVAGALGAAGGAGRIIVDRHEMYGDDPTNDPYSIKWEWDSRDKDRRPF